MHRAFIARHRSGHRYSFRLAPASYRARRHSCPAAGTPMEPRRASCRVKRIMARSYDLRIIPIELDSEIRPGDSLTGMFLQAFRSQKLSLTKGDILIVKHK